jgi:hypothetical protein
MRSALEDLKVHGHHHVAHTWRDLLPSGRGVSASRRQRRKPFQQRACLVRRDAQSCVELPLLDGVGSRRERQAPRAAAAVRTHTAVSAAAARE